MELLLTVLIWLWQIGWVLLLGGLLCAVIVLCIPPLRKRKAVTFTACAAIICLLLVVLCVRPVVLDTVDAEERAAAQQLAAGLYSDRIPVTPVCAVVEKDGAHTQVQVWYAFVGSMTYEQEGDGWSITRWLFPWN